MEKILSGTIAGILLSTVSLSSLGSVGMNSYQVPISVGVYANGKIEVAFPEVFNSGCTAGGGQTMYIEVGNSQGVTDESLKQIQSLVMAAAMAGKPIKFWYDRPNNGTVCEGGKVVMQP